MSNILEFYFNKQVIEFDITGQEVMINATEMGKVFGKEPYAFLRMQETKRFIEELKSAIPAFRTDGATELNAGNEVLSDDLVLRTVRGKANDGGSTWMHRQLALKFAAWLDPKFEVWVFQTIDRLIFENARFTLDQLKEKAKLINRKDELVKKLQANSDFQEYTDIEAKLKQASAKIWRNNNEQMSIFRNV